MPPQRLELDSRSMWSRLNVEGTASELSFWKTALAVAVGVGTPGAMGWLRLLQWCRYGRRSSDPCGGGQGAEEKTAQETVWGSWKEHCGPRWPGEKHRARENSALSSRIQCGQGSEVSKRSTFWTVNKTKDNLLNERTYLQMMYPLHS